MEGSSTGFPTVSSGKVKVLYIAGLGRSGSTLLGNILGQLDGFVSVGEIHNIWERGLVQNKVCGCGALFKECGMWQPVFEEAFGGMDRVDARKMMRLRQSWARTKHTPLMLMPPWRRLVEHRMAEYIDNLEKLYRAVQTTTNSRVIVDTSKFPSYGFVLGMAPSVDLHVVQLVRDPRAVAYSRLRERLQPDPKDPEYMPRTGAVGSTLRWMARNIAPEAFWRRYPKRYLVLRYEDFVAEPQRTIREVLEFVQEGATPLPHMTEYKVKLGVNHNIWGNPNRFQTGTVEIRPDREWISQMRPGDSRLITLLTFPLLIHYGYPLTVGGPGPETDGRG